MIKVGLLYILLLLPVGIWAQTEETEKKEETKKVVIDSLYREDQFYVSIAYNLLMNSPAGFSQNSFSLGLSAGFLRDIPLNKKRTFAIAPGVGYTFNSFRQNMKIMELDNGTMNYSINSDFERNKLETHYLDIPIEVRWRTSTPESHKFWRIYSGFKFSYLMYSKSVYTGANEKIKVFNNADLNKIQYGPYVGIGYNTFNAYAYYGLNPLFKSGDIEGEKIKINVFSFLVIFYIL